MKWTLEQQYMSSVLHSQCCACWCSGDFRSQSTSWHGTDFQNQNIPSSVSRVNSSHKQFLRMLRTCISQPTRCPCAACCNTTTGSCRYMKMIHHKSSNISHTKSQNLNDSRLILQWFSEIHWSQVLSQEWRCSWSSTDRRCSNYIWVINNSIVY